MDSKNSLLEVLKEEKEFTLVVVIYSGVSLSELRQMQLRLASVSDTNPSGVQADVSLEFSKSSALICPGCLIYKQYNLLTLVTHKLEVDQLFFFLSPVALSLVVKRELCPRS